MLTTYDHDEYVYDALEAGASGLLLKDVATRARTSSHASIPTEPAIAPSSSSTEWATRSRWSPYRHRLAEGESSHQGPLWCLGRPLNLAT